MLNGTHAIEMTKPSTVGLMKAVNSWLFERIVSVGNKTEDGENIFLKFFSQTLVNIKADDACQRTTKLFVNNLLPNGLDEKVMIC